MENIQNEQESLFSMEIDEPIKTNFLEMARWTKFLAVLGFVFLGLMLTLGLVAMAAVAMASSIAGPFAALGGVGIFVLYCLFAALEFYPIYALFKYSVCVKKALLTYNKDEFYMAISWLKNMFRYMGIMAIIFLSLYGVVIVFAMLAAMMR